MDWQDVTTEQIVAELARRYHHVAVVGVPKDKADKQLFAKGDRRQLNDLMAEFIAGRFGITFAQIQGGGQGQALHLPKMPKPSFEQQIVPLTQALAKTCGELIVCGIPRDNPTTDKFTVYVQPPPPQANEQQLKNLQRIRDRINSMPLKG